MHKIILNACHFFFKKINTAYTLLVVSVFLFKCEFRGNWIKMVNKSLFLTYRSTIVEIFIIALFKIFLLNLHHQWHEID